MHECAYHVQAKHGFQFLCATIQTQRAVLYLQSVAQTVTMLKGGQYWREEPPGTLCSPIDAPQCHEMHPRGFTASIKSRL